MAKEPISFLSAFDQAGAVDLTAVNEEIDILRKRLDGLETAKKILEVKLNGKPARKKPGPIAGPGRGYKKDQTHQARIRAAGYLLHSGVTKPNSLADAIGVLPAQRSGLFDHPWFVLSDSGISLTPEGRKMVG